MSTITYEVQSNANVRGNGWTAYRYARKNDSQALDTVWSWIQKEEQTEWIQICNMFTDVTKDLKHKGIKSTVDVDFENKHHISVCRPGKILPSIWLVADQPDNVTVAPPEPLSPMELENQRMRAALESIVKWEMPPTGKFWDKEQKEPMGYAACYGSNGERDVIRNIARQGLGEEHVHSPGTGSWQMILVEHGDFVIKGPDMPSVEYAMKNYCMITHEKLQGKGLGDIERQQESSMYETVKKILNQIG